MSHEEIKISTMQPALGAFGRWYIANSIEPQYAWTGSNWELHEDGVPAGAAQICNFSSEAEAEEYIIEDLFTGQNGGAEG